MLNHTYTSVKNANLVDCGKKQHISSQPSPLLRDNFLGEFRTELDKKKVLANLGIATSLSLEWEYIKGEVERSTALMSVLDSRTKYVTQIGEFKGQLISFIDGISYLESIIGREQDAETEQNDRLKDLEDIASDILVDLETLTDHISDEVDVNITNIQTDLDTITSKVNNITALIQVSSKEGNALTLITPEEGNETISGLYVPDLSEPLTKVEEGLDNLQESVGTMQEKLKDFVTKEDLGGDTFDFVEQSTYDSDKTILNVTITKIESDLKNTVKTGEDGHVDTLYVNKIGKNNNDEHIKITDSFEVTSNIPLDIRLVKNTVEDLYTIPASTCYAGMGVVVNSTSSLYILRKPESGVINQEYVANPASWRCPEDLVTVALTQDEYDALKEKNDKVFYYIYEEEIKRTKEPKREDYEDEDSFNQAFQEWVDSLKVLSQEYMSASWGNTIEEKLSEKATKESLNILSKQIEDIKGSDSGVSLDSINTAVTNLSASTETIANTLGTLIGKDEEEKEVGRIVNIETSINNLDKKFDSYVTYDQLEEESKGFDFASPNDVTTAIENLTNTLEESVTTNTVVLNETEVTTEDGILKVGDSLIAKATDVPSIRVMSQQEYDDMQKKDEDVYYYTFDGDIIYVTKDELALKVEQLQSQIQALLVRISALESTLTPNEPTE